ncbi:hypothetical protein N7539_008095 [Penicillium diatomitis]|uniref:Uncharacterized protein n=1 Tax=Penicillium diatomitis TaxID=2819901 RepID=A0A9W9WT62_9EURO|nr:uncharacterized protein N7539_008095 [Penicillium diatomitis]KAJ5475029.1 hypothetical protein N7539_008095 [Penicillium diatomitis]
MAEHTQNIPDSVYHVMLTISQLKVPIGQTEKIRVLGTYTSISKAKEAAHCGLYNAGYEREWFPTFETSPDALEQLATTEGTGLAVYAVANDGTKFRLRISTSPNSLQLRTDEEEDVDGRVKLPLFYVVQTNVPYCSHQRKPTHDTHIEGFFKSYAEARARARAVLLAEEDGITASSYQDYCEAGENENDCEFGENVIVHATGENGDNYFVSVVTGQALESVRICEASLRV